MASKNQTKPLLKYKPTASSLKLAEAIAEACNLEFDEDDITKQSETLFEEMYADLAAVLELKKRPPQFKFGGYAVAQASSVRTQDGQHHIILDMVFIAWISFFAHIATITAFKSLRQSDWLHFLSLTEDVFLLLTNVNQFHSVKQKFAPCLIDHSDCLNISHALERGMIIFVLCHELAHCELGHLEQPQEKNTEFEADELAAQYFVKVINSGKMLQQSSIFIDPKIASAPIILARFFEIYENWLSLKNVTKKDILYPSATERKLRLAHILKPELDETACYLREGLLKGLADLERQLLGR